MKMEKNTEFCVSRSTDGFGCRVEPGSNACSSCYDKHVNLASPFWTWWRMGSCSTVCQMARLEEAGVHRFDAGIVQCWM